MKVGHEYVVRPAAGRDLPRLPAIERAAAAAFSHEDLPPALREDGTAPGDFSRAAAEGRLFVAARETDDEPVGFALVGQVDGEAHLHEMDVLPDHGRRGLGAALLAAAAAWARDLGLRAITLTTFEHLPWNRPFYARHGYRVLAPDERTPGLDRLLREEAEAGLDAGKRVAMRLDLDR